MKLFLTVLPLISPVVKGHVMDAKDGVVANTVNGINFEDKKDENGDWHEYYNGIKCDHSYAITSPNEVYNITRVDDKFYWEKINGNRVNKEEFVFSSGNVSTPYTIFSLSNSR